MKGRILSILCGIFFVISASAQDTGSDREFDRAIVLDSLGKHAQAVKILRKLEQEPGTAYRAKMVLGRIHLEGLGDANSALGKYGEAMSLAPDSAAPYIDRSAVYLVLNMPDRALLDLEDALERCRARNDSIATYTNLSSAYGHLRKFKEAIDACDKALAVAPGDEEAMFNKATFLNELGRSDEARAMFMELYASSPNSIMLLNNLGFLASENGLYEEAITWFEKAYVLAPEDPFILNNLGYAQLRNGRPADALKNIKRSLEIHPANSYAHRNLGLVWQAMEDMPQACRCFEEALSMGYTSQYGDDVLNLRKQYCK